MTIQELYQNIGGDFDQALRVLRVDKLVDKHIRKFTKNGVVENLLAAEESMDAGALFDAAHALKGVCSNLGLTQLSELSSEVCEEFRPGNTRTLSDDEVKNCIELIREKYETTADFIQKYEEATE